MNVLFGPYRIRQKLLYKCPWCQSSTVLGKDSVENVRSERDKEYNDPRFPQKYCS